MMPTINVPIKNISELNVGDKLICLHSEKHYLTTGRHYSIYAIDLDDRLYPLSIINDYDTEYWIYAYDFSIGFMLG